ncbi:MAG: PVC-type heme-binding CxxCH protein [Bacteroidota bacterium]
MSRTSALLLPAIILLLACSRTPVEKPLVISETAELAARRAAEIEAEVPAQLAPGLTLSLWATDSLAPDPIAMSIDDSGNVFLTSTERQKNSEFDIRGHQDWMTPSIAFQSVEDRRAFLRKTFAPENSKQNEWLADLNNDGSHDWRDLAVEKDEVWKLQDTDGDGRADRSTRVVRDFNEEITDVAEGLLVREKDMFLGIGPDLWRLQDKDGDGIPEEKESISHGWAVHIGFSGHGMSGVVQGPDGKIWWGIGDIGANLTDKEGRQHAYPHEGIIVRANPDGTDLEVFASGLRNTHEFVFDAYGNLITSDNDGDHAGESERLMHIIEGADIGWRANWQYGKYTDPRNNGYNVWMDERFFVPRWEGQAAHILPPIMNYHNGPTGMVYNPGTALGKAWRDRFFLVEFVGTPTRSHIWSFTLKPKGATFVLNEEKDFLGGILPTGIRFGPDGALYAADWINGWGTKDFGRVWKIDVAPNLNDLAAERKATKEYLQLNYGKAPVDELSRLLAWSDQRIRLKAQFELVRRGMDGLKALKAAAKTGSDQLERIHGIWGLGQIAKKEREAMATLRELLADGDAEIITQSAKVLGDVRDEGSLELLMPLINHANPRVKLYAAQALGRIGKPEAIPGLIAMIDKNNDADHYIRLSGVVALARIGAEKEMAALAGSKERDLRIAAVMVLRRLRSEQLSAFLQDTDPYIITEAARAIHDDRSVPSQLPKLAALLSRTDLKQEPLLRRAISAAQRTGTDKELDLLIRFADRKDLPSAIRSEAIAALGTWSSKPNTIYHNLFSTASFAFVTKCIPHAQTFKTQTKHRHNILQTWR